jgi:hypothetical protein
MMTDALKPLGLSFRQLTNVRPMVTAGGRLFVDITQDLASAAKRDILVNVLGKSDPLFKDAMNTILARGDFIRSPPIDTNQPGASQLSHTERLRSAGRSRFDRAESNID